MSDGQAVPDKSSTRRAFLAFAALAVLPLALVLDTLVAMQSGWRPADPADGVLLGLALLALLGCGYMLSREAGRRWLAGHAPQCLLLLLSTLLTLGLLEAGLGLAGPRLPAGFHDHQPFLRARWLLPAEAFFGLAPEATCTINSLGLRGPEPPSRDQARRILCVGGSTTYCNGLGDGETWPDLLMRQLNQGAGDRPVWVGNAGVPAYTTREHLHMVRTSPLMDEVDCVLLLVGVNDLVSHPSLQSPARFPRKPLWARSRLTGTARHIRHRLGAAEAVEDPSGMYIDALRDRQAAKPSPALPDLTPHLAGYADRLRGIIAACRERGVRVVFIQQPMLWAANLPADAAARCHFGWSRVPDEYYTLAQLRDGIDRYNATLRAVCREQGVGCIDASRMDAQPQWFWDDCHFTRTGAEVLAGIIADWFRKHPEDTSGVSE